MVNFNIIGAIVWLINFVLFIILRKTPQIGPVRGGGISGWVAALVGIFFLYFKKVYFFSNINTIWMWVISVIVVFAVIIIYTQALKRGPTNKVVCFITRVGYGIGIVIGVLCAFLIP